MMKRLYMIRHAKSSWNNMSLDDFARPLNKRGKNNAPMMGRRLREKGVIPDLIISSSAKRAKKTAKLIARELASEIKMEFDDNLYDVLPSELHSKIRSIKNRYNTVFLIGHNPELNMLAQDLVDFDDNIVTCGMLEIEFDCERWIEVDKSNASLISYDYPKRETDEI
jgi:phosphohistidine phosphatase